MILYFCHPESFARFARSDGETDLSPHSSALTRFTVGYFLQPTAAGWEITELFFHRPSRLTISCPHRFHWPLVPINIPTPGKSEN